VLSTPTTNGELVDASFRNTNEILELADCTC